MLKWQKTSQKGWAKTSSVLELAVTCLKEESRLLAFLTTTVGSLKLAPIRVFYHGYQQMLQIRALCASLLSLLSFFEESVVKHLSTHH